MLDIRKLKELVRLMVANDLTELDMRDSEEQVTLRRQHFNQIPQVVTNSAAVVPTGTSPTAVAATPTTIATAAPTAGDPAIDTEGLHQITSPMVGTFYAAANPDSPPFVKVGDRVDADTVVCLVEAMKIFNEIKAECSGTVERIVVANSDSVDFGQPMFLVRPG